MLVDPVAIANDGWGPGRCISGAMKRDVSNAGGEGVLDSCAFCCNKELACMRMFTSLDRGPDILTAVATASCVATDTSFTVT